MIFARGSPHGTAHFGSGSGPTWVDQLNCSGSEADIADCPRNAWGQEDCEHSEDAGVTCGEYSRVVRVIIV